MCSCNPLHSGARRDLALIRVNVIDATGASLQTDPRLKYVKPSWARRWVRMTVEAEKTPNEEWAKRRALVQQEKALVGLLHRQGVEILAGTDESNPFSAPGFSLHDELADLVLLDANTLLDIRNTRKINAVVVNGRLLDRQTLDGC